MPGAAGRPKVHAHLDREAIAKAGLALIDRRGLEALTLRRVAHELGVGTTTLYSHIRSKDEIVLDIVALLLDEVDSDERPGEDWDVLLRRVVFSTREMALRHPRAFPLWATAPDDQPPVLDYARRFMRQARAHGLGEEQALVAWQVIGGYLTGFLLQEAAERVRALAQAPPAARDARPPDPLRDRMAHVHSGEAFATGLEIVFAGLRQRRAIPE